VDPKKMQKQKMLKSEDSHEVPLSELHHTVKRKRKTKRCKEQSQVTIGNDRLLNLEESSTNYFRSKVEYWI